jgi:glc operon protein GlcG
MVRQVSAVLIVTGLTVAAAAIAGAQAPAPGQAPGGGGRAQAASPARIELAAAQQIVAAAVAAARAANVNVAAAIVDANGDLVYFQRLDGAVGRPVVSSQAKARAAILFGVPTKVAEDAAAAGTPLSATLTPSGIGTFEIAVRQGGIPLIKGGKIIGAIGVGGGTPAQDETFAKAGAETLK